MLINPSFLTSLQRQIVIESARSIQVLSRKKCNTILHTFLYRYKNILFPQSDYTKTISYIRHPRCTVSMNLLRTFALIALSLTSHLSYSQQNKIDKTQIEKTLCQSWKYSFTTSNGTKMSHVFDFQITFDKDLSFTQNNMGEIRKGTWCYSNELNVIQMKPSTNVVVWVVIISDKELLLVKDGDFLPLSRELPKTYSVYTSKTKTSDKPKQRR